MGSGDNVLGIDESTTAGVDRLLGVLLQNGHMPGVLAELTVSIHVDGVLDAAGDSGGVPHSTTTELAHPPPSGCSGTFRALQRHPCPIQWSSSELQ